MEIVRSTTKSFTPYSWDEFVSNSWNGTFLQSQRFLSYHASKSFEDLSYWFLDGEKPLGVIPIAKLGQDTAVSHAGATFGGLIHKGGLVGRKSEEAFRLLANALRQERVKTFFYLPVPTIYHRTLCQEDWFALFQLGAKLVRADIASVLDVFVPKDKLTKGRICQLKKAKDAQLQTDFGREHFEEAWALVEQSLERKYRVKPVHSKTEMIDLLEKFPLEILPAVTRLDGKVLSATILFKHTTALHTQYLAVSEKGEQVGAMDFLVQDLIEKTREENIRYFSFGTSSERQGYDGKIRLNEGLHFFKSSFRAGSVVHGTFRLDL